MTLADRPPEHDPLERLAPTFLPWRINIELLVAPTPQNAG
jgi:hypothetical protein